MTISTLAKRLVTALIRVQINWALHRNAEDLQHILSSDPAQSIEPILLRRQRLMQHLHETRFNVVRFNRHVELKIDFHTRPLLPRQREVMQ